MAGTAFVLQLEGEAAGVAEAVDRRWRGDEHLRVGHVLELPGQARGDGVGMSLRRPSPSAG
jgi:hypothetical protein